MSPEPAPPKVMIDLFLPLAEWIVAAQTRFDTLEDRIQYLEQENKRAHTRLREMETLNRSIHVILAQTKKEME